MMVMGKYEYGGERGIRTHEPGFARLPAFEAGSFNRSDTSPLRLYFNLVFSSLHVVMNSTAACDEPDYGIEHIT